MRAGPRWTVLAVVALALTTWPFESLTPGIVGDWNWVAGLAMVLEHGYDYGDELAWNYGPLGLVTSTGPLLYYGDIAAAMFVYQIALQLLLAATLYLAARRSYPAPVAAGVAFVAIALIQDRTLLLAFAWCVLALTRADDAPRDALARWFPVGVGVLAGILALAKLNHGVEILALAAIALVARPNRRPRDAATFGAALVATVALGWLATGQPVADFAAYVRYGAETIGGYPAALGASDPDGAWRYWGAAGLFALGSLLTWAAVRDARPRRRWGLLALWLVFAFASFKAGFVRHDGAHASLYAGSMLAALAVLPVNSTAAWRGAGIAGIAACAVYLAAVTPDFRLWQRVDPVANAKAGVEQATVLASRDDRRRQRARLAQDILDHYAPPARVVAQIADRTVSFLPYSFGSLAYALGVDWRVPPIVETYGASTRELDELVADMFSSPRAPERIVRVPRPPADRGVSLDPPPHELMLEAPFDPPLTTRAVFCRYRELMRDGSWQLLARRADRCADPRVVGTVKAPWGARVNVPEPLPGTAVLVQVHGTETAGAERLKALWLRPDARMIVLDGRPYRLLPSTAPSGYLMRAAPGVDYAPPLAMAPNPSSITVRRIGDDQPGGELRYTFLELPVHAAPSGCAPRAKTQVTRATRRACDRASR